MLIHITSSIFHIQHSVGHWLLLYLWRLLYLHNVSKWPVMWKGICCCRKRYAKDNKQQICYGKVHDQYICRVSHLFVKRYNKNNEKIPDKADQDNEREEDWNNNGHNCFQVLEKFRIHRDYCVFRYVSCISHTTIDELFHSWLKFIWAEWFCCCIHFG